MGLGAFAAGAWAVSLVTWFKEKKKKKVIATSQPLNYLLQVRYLTSLFMDTCCQRRKYEWMVMSQKSGGSLGPAAK